MTCRLVHLMAHAAQPQLGELVCDGTSVRPEPAAVMDTPEEVESKAGVCVLQGVSQAVVLVADIVSKQLLPTLAWRVPLTG